MSKRCSVPGCENKHLAKGFCSTHYWRHRKFGDALHGGDIGGGLSDAPWNSAARDGDELENYRGAADEHLGFNYLDAEWWKLNPHPSGCC
jgi:hypothetical protein